LVPPFNWPPVTLQLPTLTIQGEVKLVGSDARVKLSKNRLMAGTTVKLTVAMAELGQPIMAL